MPGAAQIVPGAGAPQAPAPSLTLDQAIAAAVAADPIYASSLSTSGAAQMDHALARSALLPNAAAHGQYLYTQPNGVRNQAGQIGSQAAPRFIANNAIREYAAQVMVNESIGVAGYADLQRTRALALEAAADLESARRDLVVRVVQLYFGLLDAENKLQVAAQARDEANGFDRLTRQLENGREVAHADVVKADLELQQREREWSDASLAEERARLDLGTLLFPDPRTPYTLAAQPTPALPSQPEVEAQAAKQNPDLRSALQARKAADAAVLAARAGYLPSLSFNYTWGIDAPQFAVFGPDRVRNLGYSASASIDFPVWDWFATHDKVKQSELQQSAARVALTAMERTLIAQLQEFYHEAQIAGAQVASLQTSVQTAQESLRLTKLRYQAGEATALEVVDAESSLALVEAQQADGVLRYRVALANLQTLTGVL
ncbi:MAG TPA: TolC family protein [Acidobacteriaceae bacterium]|jgi:outer membrane protein TolC|nr:TolC family protein [Acidobacteriaceae bacterium]